MKQQALIKDLCLFAQKDASVFRTSSSNQEILPLIKDRLRDLKKATSSSEFQKLKSFWRRKVSFRKLKTFTNCFSVIPLIGSYTWKNKLKIFSVVNEWIYLKNTVLLREGQMASKLMVICSGEVLITNKVNPFGEVRESKEIEISEEDKELN